MSSSRKSVLFICLGNICRSPIAEAVFLNLVKQKGVQDQIKKSDFTEFDYILGMDEDNMSDLKDMKPKNATAKVQLLGQYDPEGERIIEDPYYGEDEGFEQAYTQCCRCCKGFLDTNS